MQCRYCLETNGPFVRPCACVTPVHHKCLQKWKSIRKLPHCEICLTKWPRPPQVWPIYMCISAILLYMLGLHTLIIKTGVLIFSFGALATIFMGIVMWLWPIPLIIVGGSSIKNMCMLLHQWAVSPLLLIIYTETSWEILPSIINSTECLLVPFF